MTFVLVVKKKRVDYQVSFYRLTHIQQIRIARHVRRYDAMMAVVDQACVRHENFSIRSPYSTIMLDLLAVTSLYNELYNKSTTK